MLTFACRAHLTLGKWYTPGWQRGHVPEVISNQCPERKERYDMSVIARALSIAAASVLFIAPSRYAVKDGCSTTSGGCTQGHWRTAPVRFVPKVSQAVIDSVITVHADDGNRMTVLYAFNNNCEDYVTARIRRLHDTLDVRFITTLRGVPKKKASPPEVLACSASIDNVGYAVTVNAARRGPYVVRGFVGTSSWTKLAAQRSVEVR